MKPSRRTDLSGRHHSEGGGEKTTWGTVHAQSVVSPSYEAFALDRDLTLPFIWTSRQGLTEWGRFLEIPWNRFPPWDLCAQCGLEIEFRGRGPRDSAVDVVRNCSIAAAAGSEVA